MSKKSYHLGHCYSVENVTKFNVLQLRADQVLPPFPHHVSASNGRQVAQVMCYTIGCPSARSPTAACPDRVCFQYFFFRLLSQ